jgi:hypothetical protein
MSAFLSSLWGETTDSRTTFGAININMSERKRVPQLGKEDFSGPC